MKCPNCDKEMEDKRYTKLEPFYHWEDEEVYYQKNTHEKFLCKSCGISYTNDKWKIPQKYFPTEKQKKTILYINNHLGMNIQPLTKHQCWINIGEYFEKAKNTPLHDNQYYIDIQEYYGMSEGDFC